MKLSFRCFRFDARDGAKNGPENDGRRTVHALSLEMVQVEAALVLTFDSQGFQFEMQSSLSFEKGRAEYRLAGAFAIDGGSTR